MRQLILCLQSLDQRHTESVSITLLTQVDFQTNLRFVLSDVFLQLLRSAPTLLRTKIFDLVKASVGHGLVIEMELDAMDR